MEEFKTNICNALMKQSLTLIYNCLNNKRDYNWKIKWTEASLSELVTLGSEPLRDGRRIPVDHLVQILTFLHILSTEVMRKIIPSQPLRAKEVEVSFLHKLKPLIKTWGRVVTQLIQKDAHWSRKLSVRNTMNNIKNIPLESKDSGGSLSHRQSLSLKREKPTEPKPIKEA